MNIFCDPSTALDYNPIADTTNPCEPTVTIISQFGCPPVTVSSIWTYIAQYSQYFGIFFLIGGFMLCFLGFRLIGPSICIVGLLTSVAVTCVIFYAVFFTATTDPKQFLYWLGAGAVIGIGLGCLLMKKQKAGVGMLAGWGGIALGLILQQMFVYRFGYPWTTYVCMLGCASLTGWAATKWYDPIIVISTSVIGSYSITQGAAFYLGHEFNIFTAAKLVQANLSSQIDQWYWMYMGGFFIFAILGYVIQMKQKKKQNRKKKKKSKSKSKSKDRR